MVIRSLSVALVFAVVFGILFPKAGIAESTRSEDFAKDPDGLKAWLEPWLPGASQAGIRWTSYDWDLNGL